MQSIDALRGGSFEPALTWVSMLMGIPAATLEQRVAHLQALEFLYETTPLVALSPSSMP
jgi:hypothetical protein